MSKLKRVLRAFLIILGVLVLSLVLLGILLVHNARDWDAFLERYHQYSPKVCYNTKWTCAERDIYFYSDADGMTLGVVNTGAEPKYFDITFRTDTHDGLSGYADISEIKGLAYDAGTRLFMISAGVEYYEDRCVISYVEDRDQFWGPCEEGEVVLTFWKEELGEPFRYANYKEIPGLMVAR